MTPPRHTCVRNGEIICPDDLCHSVTTTLCGLESGIDFDLHDWGPEYEDDDDEESP